MSLDSLQSAAVIDLIMLLLVVEAVALLLVERRAGRRRRLMTLSNAAAGIALLAALRVSLSGGGTLLFALALAAALGAHVADLGLRRRLVDGG